MKPAAPVSIQDANLMRNLRPIILLISWVVASLAELILRPVVEDMLPEFRFKNPGQTPLG